MLYKIFLAPNSSLFQKSYEEEEDGESKHNKNNKNLIFHFSNTIYPCCFSHIQ